MPIWPMSARRCYSCALVAAAHSHTRARARLISIARQLPERLPASALPVADALPSCWSALRRYVQCSRAVCGHGEDAANVSLLHRVDTSSGCAQPLGPQRSPPLLAHVPVCTAPPLPARAVASAARLARISLRARRACARSRATSLLPACCFPSCALLHPCSRWLTLFYFGAQIYSYSGAAYPFPPPSSPPPPCPPPSPPLPPPEPP